MDAHAKLAVDLRALEEGLLDPRVRASPGQVDLMLSDDFVEFGSSGQVYDKDTVIEGLKQDPGFDGTRTIAEFKLRVLSPSVVLVTYRVGETGTLRSSIWQSSDGRWKMVFHQGTRSESK